MSLVVAHTDAIPAEWWQEMPNRACIMNFACDERTVSVAADRAHLRSIGALAGAIRTLIATAGTNQA